MATSRGALGPREHLLNAGKHIKDGHWSDSIRESIHAVESIATELAPKGSTLGKALEPLQKQGLTNPRLKQAFVKLYAYTNEEKGVRHAFLFDQPQAKVDETDALFMLGACGSFVSYLLSRVSQLKS